MLASERKVEEIRGGGWPNLRFYEDIGREEAGELRALFRTGDGEK